MSAREPSRYVLTDSELMAVGSHGVSRAVAKGQLVVREGEAADSLFIILQGSVKVYVSDGNGRDMVLGTQGAGEYFGEMSLDEGPRSASVQTLEDSRFLVVPKAGFRSFMLRNPAFALSLIDKLIGRARTLTASVKSLALMDVYGRVARLLLDMAEEREGQYVIAQRLTQQDIASRIGASREMVSRILKDLTQGGYLTQSSTGMVLHRKPPAHW